MRIELLGWESKGLRCPDAAVDLRIDGEPAQIALIQMPNGTGKTTTLQMLMATLTGVANQWRPEFIRSLRRPGDEQKKGTFQVDLQADGTPITVELDLDFEEGSVQYRTTTPATGGVLRKWAPPPGLRRFVTPEFIRLFIFDGEFAERLLKDDTNEAERAIEALCELYLLDEIEGVANDDWERAVRNAGPSTSQGLTRAQNDRDKVRSQIRKAEKAREKANERLSDIQTQMTSLNAQIETHISEHSEIREQHERAIEEKAEAERRLERALGDLFQRLRFPHAIHSAVEQELIGLKDNLDQLQLPESTTRQFFIELARAQECVCGRPLDDDTREAIATRADQYMGEDEAGAINALKEDIDRYCTADGDSSFADIQEKTRELSEAMHSVQLADQTVRGLKRQLIDKGDEHLKALEQQHSQLEREHDELKEVLQDIDREPVSDEDLEDSYCLKALKSELDRLNEKISRITNTLGHRRRVETLTQIVHNAKQVARDSIKHKVRTECNNTLRTILSNDPLYIDEIAGNLKIHNQRGASVGQNLSIGYAFLLNLLHRGTNQFPLVVDSPCGALDDGRREAIGSLIPKLATQFISFVIPTERPHFVEALEGASDGEIAYLTLFRNSDSEVSRYPTPPATGVQMTNTGTLVYGREYFLGFRA